MQIFMHVDVEQFYDCVYIYENAICVAMVTICVAMVTVDEGKARTLRAHGGAAV